MITRPSNLTNAVERIKLLERQIDELQSLVRELQQQLAALQQQAQS